MLDGETLAEVELIAWYLHLRERSLKPNVSGALRRIVEGAIRGKHSKALRHKAFCAAKPARCEMCKTTHPIPYCYLTGKALVPIIP